MNATAGTFTLAYEGETTGPITYNATAAGVQAALTAVIGAGKLTVAGGPTGEDNVSRWVVTFAKSTENVGELEASGTQLQGGTHTATATRLGEENGSRDSYTLTVTNTGSTTTSGVVTIRDILPPGVMLPPGVEHPVRVAVNLETQALTVKALKIRKKMGSSVSDLADPAECRMQI